MKTRKVLVATGVLAVLLAGLLLIPSAESSTRFSVNAGLLCWETGDGRVLTVTVTNMGNNHYFLNGRFTSLTSTEGIVEPVLGSAELQGNDIYLTTTSSGSNGAESWEYVGHATLNAATLNGSIEFLGSIHNKIAVVDPFNIEPNYIPSMTLTSISCPK